MKRTFFLLWLMLAAAAPGTFAGGVPAATPHPLDPLSARELADAVRALRTAGRLGSSARLTCLRLAEPPKAEVLTWKPGDPVVRRAFAAIYDYASNTSTETTVELKSGVVAEARPLPGVQSPYLPDDQELTEGLVAGDARWLEALRKRGLTPADVFISGGPPGAYAPVGGGGSRVVLAGTWLREPAPMGGAVEGLTALVDLTRRRVLSVTDRGGPAVRLQPGAVFDGAVSGPLRKPLPPLRTTLPMGPSYRVDGHEVRWENWRFRFSVDPRVGLTLHQVGYEDRGQVRTILYKAGLSEMVVPYGDPGWLLLCPFDAGDFGLLSYGGVNLNRLGDAPEHAQFFPAAVADAYGRVRELPRAVAIYERDGGILWRHADTSRRARDLVVVWFTTVDNYDYGFSWIFHQDGSMDVEVQLTGMVNFKLVERFQDPHVPGRPAATFGHLVAPNIEAPHHQHFFNFRLDFDVDDGPNNLFERETAPTAEGEENPSGQAFRMLETPLASELAARRETQPAGGRHWVVANAARRNPRGHPTGFALLPGENSRPAAAPNSYLRRAAGFVEHQLWATPFAAAEQYAAGDYVATGQDGQGLPAWTRADRPLRDTDVVLWYTLGVTHFPRVEDWPVMPTHRASFRLAPMGFFARNPALDVPAPSATPPPAGSAAGKARPAVKAAARRPARG